MKNSISPYNKNKLSYLFEHINLEINFLHTNIENLSELLGELSNFLEDDIAKIINDLQNLK